MLNYLIIIHFVYSNTEGMSTILTAKSNTTTTEVKTTETNEILLANLMTQSPLTPNTNPSQNTMGMAQNNMGMPQNNMGMSHLNMGMPLNNIGISQQNMGMPQNNMGMNQQNIGMPQNNMGISQQNMGMPQNIMGMSQQNMGMPQNIMGLSHNMMSLNSMMNKNNMMGSQQTTANLLSQQTDSQLMQPNSQVSIYIYILSVYSPFSDRVGFTLHNIHIPSPFL